jgi:DNA-binding MarR family transcriptional regulator
VPESTGPSELIEAVRALSRLSRIVNPGVGGLSTADYRVMSAIGSGEDRASRLAARLALGKPTISATVESLCRRGLVIRSGVPGDSRAVALALSPIGGQVLELVESRMSRQLELLCERTPDAEQVVRSLTWIAAAIEAAVLERAERERRMEAADDAQ